MFIILAVVLINALLGVYQGARLKKAIEALQMTAAQSRVVQGSHVQTVHSEELVPGDVVLLEAGEAVPADGRLLEAVALKIEEAALTGESLPVEKSEAALPGGRARPGRPALHGVYGQRRELRPGQAADHRHRHEHRDGPDRRGAGSHGAGKTPLQQKLMALSKALSALVLAICVFLFLALGCGEAGTVDLPTVLSTFMVAVSLAVAAIPEGAGRGGHHRAVGGVTKMSRQGR